VLAMAGNLTATEHTPHEAARQRSQS
jgi:hypothetical protein